MNTLRIVLFVALLAGALPGAGAAPGVESATEMTPETRKLIQDTCFEVVVLRPEKDSLRYERELPWDLVPFAIRNDKYISIGTAFAVSRDEMVTAHHVLELDENPLSEQRYFIRDANQNVYELDRVTASEMHRDVARFTVKGRTFDRWLELNPTYELNRAVYTVGNALGEGIVIRRGELIGTLPEEDSGAFVRLKSSADVNPGNSGGPLVDPEGKVLGVVLSRKDNICQSIPTAELQAIKPGAAVYYNKMVFGFSILPEKSTVKEFRCEVPLPLTPAELKARAAKEFQAVYQREMESFLAPEGGIFPEGDASLEAILEIPTSVFPQVLFKDKDTNKWSSTEFKYQGSNLGREGRCHYTVASEILFTYIMKPEGRSLKGLMENPRETMELFLQGVNLPRKLGGQDTRITSLGDPVRRDALTDRWGRRWAVNVWHLEYSDSAFVGYFTPTTDGVVIIGKFVPSSNVEMWLYDLRRLLDFTYVPYSGKLKNWEEFLQMTDALPEGFRDIRFAYVTGKSLTLQTRWLALSLDKNTLEIGPDATLGLCMGFGRKGGAVEWLPRRLAVAESEDENYFVVLRHLNPGEGLSESLWKKWCETARERHPYTRTPFTDAGKTAVARVLPGTAPRGTAPEAVPELYTLYLSRSGTVPDKQMKQRLERVAEAIRLAPGPAGK
ncbi:MAG: trypsin-like peptidase domain-containing protein [Acidobacteria bacterium]|nr:trypsin-like peptidase domain-containing protein [Acidobacteriota bacterium]